MDIDFGGTISTIGYSYVLTLDEGVLSWKYVKKVVVMIYYANINYSICSMHIDNEIVIFKVSSKNVNENLTDNDERQMY